jgi:hypothetical protein
MTLENTLNTYARSSRKISDYCAYQELYSSLPEADKKALDSAWAKNYPVNLIVKALRTEGHKTSSDSVRAHKSGQCRCPKK